MTCRVADSGCLNNVTLLSCKVNDHAKWETDLNLLF